MSHKFLAFLMILPAIFSAACSGPGLAFFSASTPTPASVISFEVAVSVATPTQTPTAPPSSTPTPSPAPTLEPLPVLMETVDLAQPASLTIPLTPSPTATVTPGPTANPAGPTVISPSPLSSTVTSEVIPPTASAAPPDPSLPSGIITLLAPDPGTILASEMNELEFKWAWQGDTTLERCGSLPDYGFELRIWPARDGFGPLGAMDAAKNAEDIFLGCNPETGIRSYALKFLHSAPGVKAGGAGKFLWDVALVKLKPYEPILTTPPRIFEISFDYHGSLDPFGTKLSCGDFGSWAEAQAVFLAAGGPSRDPHELDPDGDGQACNELLGG